MPKRSQNLNDVRHDQEVTYVRLAAIAGPQNEANFHGSFTFVGVLRQAVMNLGDWSAWILRVGPPIIAEGRLRSLHFVERIEGKRFVLINGDQLADLMIDHGLGVTTTQTYEIRKVSNYFFDEVCLPALRSGAHRRQPDQLHRRIFGQRSGNLPRQVQVRRPDQPARKATSFTLS